MTQWTSPGARFTLICASLLFSTQSGQAVRFSVKTHFRTSLNPFGTIRLGLEKIPFSRITLDQSINYPRFEDFKNRKLSISWAVFYWPKRNGTLTSAQGP